MENSIILAISSLSDSRKVMFIKDYIKVIEWYDTFRTGVTCDREKINYAKVEARTDLLLGYLGIKSTITPIKKLEILASLQDKICSLVA